MVVNLELDECVLVWGQDKIKIIIFVQDKVTTLLWNALWKHWFSHDKNDLIYEFAATYVKANSIANCEWDEDSNDFAQSINLHDYYCTEHKELEFTGGHHGVDGAQVVIPLNDFIFVERLNLPFS